MPFQIEHTTTFQYASPVREAVGEARLHPREDGGQRVLSFRLALDPPAPFDRITDRFGNIVHCYSVLPPHRRLIVTAHSLVEPGAGPLIAQPALSLIERHEFGAPSTYAPPSDTIAAFARAHAPAGGDAEATAYALMQAVGAHCAYEPGSTDISTTAAMVLAGRRGVCQDFAHLLIALCRSQGLPARYVSGYFHDPAQPPEAILASHAWAEVFLAGRGWLGLDPTHSCAVGPGYVRIAIGRDYADAAPIRGIYQGEAREALAVRVRMTLA